MIKTLGFLDTSTFTAMFVLKHREKASDGVLKLRDFKDDEVDPSDLPILKEWKSARALLTRVRSSAAPFLGGKTPTLGRAWIDIVPPLAGTGWASETGEYADQHVRTRTCLIPCPGAMSYSGVQSANLLVGMVNLVDHRSLCSEVNFGEHARVHLVVDVRVPDDPVEP